MILREDARSGGADHLAEPWSVELRDTRLTSFLAMAPGDNDLGDAAFLSGQITDAQARLNLSNLIVGSRVSERDVQAFERLFDALGIERAELDQMVANLLLAVVSGTPQDGAADIPILPRRMEQLRWLGLSGDSVARLLPHVVVLPTRTQFNLNTASALVIAARIPEIDDAQARDLVAARARSPFRALSDVARLLPAQAATLNPSEVGVSSRFFEIRGHLRLEDTQVDEHALVQRNGMAVTTVWREREIRDPRAAPGASR